MAHKYVYLFDQGNANMRELLGGKGANLAEMTHIGLPVPQGFTSTIRKSHENPAIKKIYKEFLEKQGSHVAHQLLHTNYEEKKKYNI